MKSIINRKAYYDYYIEDTLECGISLYGNEVKSIRDGRVNLKDSWCIIDNGNLLLKSMHISKWKTSNIFDIEENRDRTLLAHKSEILNLSSKVSIKGYTLIPLKVYFKNNRCKILIGICRGKHNYDKRESLKLKQINRDISRELKNRG